MDETRIEKKSEMTGRVRGGREMTSVEPVHQLVGLPLHHLQQYEHVPHGAEGFPIVTLPGLGSQTPGPEPHRDDLPPEFILDLRRDRQQQARLAGLLHGGVGYALAGCRWFEPSSRPHR